MKTDLTDAEINSVMAVLRQSTHHKQPEPGIMFGLIVPLANAAFAIGGMVGGCWFLIEKFVG